jgi:hypothetical protein
MKYEIKEVYTEWFILIYNGIKYEIPYKNIGLELINMIPEFKAKDLMPITEELYQKLKELV